MNCASSFFDWVKARAEEIKIGFAIIAAGWILLEYYGKQNEARVERTVEYMKQLSEGDLAAADLKMSLFWLEKSNLDKLRSLPEGDKLAYSNFIVTSVESSLKTEVWQTFGFYRGLAICVNSGLCDAKTACDRFGRDINVFYENYGPYFKHYDATYHDDALKQVRTMLEQCSPPKV